MEAQSSYTLISVGLAIRLLRYLTGSKTVDFATVHIGLLEEGLAANSFNVSLAGMDELLTINKKLADHDANEELGKEIAEQITTEMTFVEKTVFAEAMTKRVYTFAERRFNSDYLRQHPDKLFKSGIHSRLPDIARSDVAGACRCILFGEATAAAFHILRATEDVLRQYYFHHKKRNRLAKPMWGPMTTELRTKKTNKPPAVVLDSLDLVRTSYRNPTQHPDTTYDIESVQDLMGVCIDLINRMAAELPSR